MKNVTRANLRSGMVIGKDILNTYGEVVVAARTKVTDAIISALAMNSIIVVPIMDQADYATTYFEKMRYSDEYRHFEQAYQKLFPTYRDMMTALAENGTPVETDALLSIYKQLMEPVPSNKELLDYLYIMLPNEDELTHTHCLNSALIAGVFADWLCLTQEDKELLVLCAFFYDIGKLKLPYELLWKSEKLTDEEFDLIKTHPKLGFEMVKHMKYLHPAIVKCILMHHERCDGTGYPCNLKMQQIDYFSRLIAIVDAYEAMTSPRAYRQSLTPLQVVARLEENGMTEYDYEILYPIMKRISETQLGLTAKLSDGSMWEIFLPNKLRFSRPVLKRTIPGQETSQFLDLMRQSNLEIIAIY